MRFYEIKSGIQIPLSNEELILVDYLEENPSLSSDELDERGLELARLLVSRGVLNRIEIDDNKVEFTLNRLEDIWRD